MATTFDCMSMKGLRLAHLKQLMSYVEYGDREGWYYGNKQQFEDRHKDLVNWVGSMLEYAESEGVRMPK